MMSVVNAKKFSYAVLLTFTKEFINRKLRFLCRDLCQWGMNINSLTINVPHHMETSQLICIANQLTSFYVMGSIGR